MKQKRPKISGPIFTGKIIQNCSGDVLKAMDLSYPRAHCSCILEFDAQLELDLLQFRIVGLPPLSILNNSDCSGNEPDLRGAVGQAADISAPPKDRYELIAVVSDSERNRTPPIEILAAPSRGLLSDVSDISTMRTSCARNQSLIIAVVALGQLPLWS